MTEDPNQAPERRRFGLLTATSLVVASMIGTGVFTSGGVLLGMLPSRATVILGWAVAGLWSLAGALSYAELSAALPKNGGEYALLRRSLHPAAGFIAGVVSYVVGFAAPTAAAAIGFGEYLEPLFPGIPPAATGAGLIVVAVGIQLLGAKVASRFQNLVTALKVILIVAFLASITHELGMPSGVMEELRHSTPLSGPFLVVIVFISYSYSGWNAATYVAAEVERPGRNLPLALFGGCLLVTLLYMAFNLVLLWSAPAEVITGEVDIVRVATEQVFGRSAGNVVAALVAFGLISMVGALLMTGSRVLTAMEADHPLLSVITGGPKKRERRSLLLLGALSIAMALSASFEALLIYVGAVLSLSASATVVGLFVLRHREPDLPRPYRAIGYPVVPALFILLTVGAVMWTFATRPFSALVTAATLVLGYLLYLWIGRESVGGPKAF